MRSVPEQAAGIEADTVREALRRVMLPAASMNVVAPGLVHDIQAPPAAVRVAALRDEAPVLLGRRPPGAARRWVRSERCR